MKSAVKKMENKKKISEISSKSVTWACVCTKKERKRETEYKKKKKSFLEQNTHEAMPKT